MLATLISLIAHARLVSHRLRQGGFFVEFQISFRAAMPWVDAQNLCRLIGGDLRLERVALLLARGAALLPFIDTRTARRRLETVNYDEVNFIRRPRLSVAPPLLFRLPRGFAGKRSRNTGTTSWKAFSEVSAL